MTLAIQNGSVRRGAKSLIDGVSLSFEAGSLTALIGPNGAGKSTLLRACSGLLALDAGAVSVGTQQLSDLKPNESARLISMMSQRFESPQLSVLDVVLLGRSAHLGRFGVASARDREAAMTAADELGVGELVNRAFPSLSGGERQRVLFAMQTLQAAPVALFDEPNSAQDFDGTRLMLRVMKRRAEQGDCVVAVVHDLNLALRGFDRVVCLSAGKVVADGAAEETVASDAVNEAFSGALRVEEAEHGIVVLPAL